MKRIILLVLCILLVTSAYALDTKTLYKQTVGSVVVLTVMNSKGGCTGTGFFALEPDIIVTCYHVVEGATNITAKTNKGNIVSIEGIIDSSKEKDIALLKASSKNSSVLELQANMPTPGTPAYVLGSPQGLDFSFSDGVISQIRREKETLIQFTCPVSSGNSGGPLLSEEGKVLGIVSCQLTEGQNLNFAVLSASLYMLNKDNAVTKINKSDIISNNSNSDGLTDDDAFKKALEHYRLGCNYSVAGLHDEADNEFLLALKISHDKLKMLNLLATHFSGEATRNKILLDEVNLNKNYEILKKTVESGIKISINNNDTRFLGSFYSHLAEVYKDGYKNIDKAIELYRLIINNYLDKSFWNNSKDEKYKGFIFSGLASCFHDKKEYRKAINNYEESLKYYDSKQSDNICMLIGYCYFNLKDYKSAQKYAEKVLKNNPKDGYAKELLEDCKKQLRRK